MNRFAFVILNYMTKSETEKCVESIINVCKKYEYMIYIVDNNSPDKSGESLKNEYNKNKKIEVILCNENLGFANGNNVGFVKAKNEFNADFIILCNSDTVILSNNFCKQIENKYASDTFAVMGPKEILPDGTCYPLNNNYPTIESTQKNIKIIKKKLRANNNYLYAKYYNFTLKLKSLIKKHIKNNTISNKLNPDVEYKNLVLHGFFLIFSKIYIDKFDGLDNRTYFYGEEDLLSIRLKKENMISLYFPSIEVLHNKNSATIARNKDLKNRNNFIYSNQLKSFKILLDELKSSK